MTRLSAFLDEKLRRFERTNDMQNSLVPDWDSEGLVYRREFISSSEHSAIVDFVSAQKDWIPLGAKERLPFGWLYSVSSGGLRKTTPIPPILQSLSFRLVDEGLMTREAEQAVIQRYPRGSRFE